MTIKELIAVLSKYDDDLEVVSAVPEPAYDIYAYSEYIDICSIEESDFEVDDNYRALVFKYTGYLPEPRDWDNSYPDGIPWKESSK